MIPLWAKCPERHDPDAPEGTICKSCGAQRLPAYMDDVLPGWMRLVYSMRADGTVWDAQGRDVTDLYWHGLKMVEEQRQEDARRRRKRNTAARHPERARDGRAKKARARDAELNRVLARVATDEGGACRPLAEVLRAVKRAGLRFGRTKVAERLAVLKAKSGTDIRAAHS